MFQFQKVRLQACPLPAASALSSCFNSKRYDYKHRTVRSRFRRWHVSIPKGTITRKSAMLAFTMVTKFQFQKVRLQEFQPISQTSNLGSFNSKRYDYKISVISNCQAVGEVSIPKGTITSFTLDKKIRIGNSFNSKRYDYKTNSPP